MTDALTSIALWTIAALYAAVGHGGASGYLAVLSLSSPDAAPDWLRAQALLLNTGVSAIAFTRYRAHGLHDISTSGPLIAGSVPVAWLVGRLTLDGPVFDALLVLSLGAAGARLAMVDRPIETPRPAPHPAVWVGIGAALGALSGATGIGGGVFLSPLLILTGWCDAARAAPTTALFVLVNSLAGLAGLASGPGIELSPAMPIWLIATWLGGWLGAGWGRQAPPLLLRRVLAAVLLAAALHRLARALAG